MKSRGHSAVLNVKMSVLESNAMCGYQLRGESRCILLPSFMCYKTKKILKIKPNVAGGILKICIFKVLESKNIVCKM